VCGYTALKGLSYLVLASLFSGECLVMGFLVCSVF